jgi:multiple sugar transport system substrate-binding protein
MNRYLLGALSTMVASCLILAGCGNESAEPGAPTPAKTTGSTSTGAGNAYTGGPAEVVGYFGSFTEDQVNNLLASAVKKKYPEISIKSVPISTKGTMADKISEWTTANQLPDLIYFAGTQVNDYLQADVPEELTPYIKRFNIDMNRYEPALVNDMKKFVVGKPDVIYGLPVSQNYGATMYSKDLFDKFAVPYPPDAITWEDTLEYNKKLTRQDSGTQYIGVGFNTPLNMLKQYGVANEDSKDMSIAKMTTPGHQYILNLLLQFAQVPGYLKDNKYSDNINNGGTDNILAGTQAMNINWINVFATRIDAAKTISAKWDLTGFPTFKDHPNQGANVDFGMMAVAKTSKIKEAAYRVLEVMVSDEYQLAMSRSGRFTALRSNDIKSQFGKGSGLFDGKNLAAILKVPPTPVPSYPPYKAQTDAAFNKAVDNVLLKGVDVNTALRGAEEEANAAIKAEKAK